VKVRREALVRLPDTGQASTQQGAANAAQQAAGAAAFPRRREHPAPVPGSTELRRKSDLSRAACR